MELSPFDALEQRREPLHQSRRRDPPERRAFTHPEPALTKVEHRRACGTQVQASLLHLDQMRDQPRGQHMAFRAEHRESRYERVIGEVGQSDAMHSTSLPS